MSYWGHGEYHKADWGVNENQPIEHFMHKCCDDRDSAKWIGMGSIFTDSFSVNESTHWSEGSSSSTTTLSMQPR